MKSVIIAALLLISTVSYSQSKKMNPKLDHSKAPVDSTAKDSLKVVSGKQYFCILSDQEVGTLVAALRTSGKYSSNDIDVYVNDLLKKFREVVPTAPADSTKKK